ncbi:MAG: OmpA family protein [Pseudomonadota bacterium]
MVRLFAAPQRRVAAVVVTALFLGGCASSGSEHQNKARGAAIGAATGAIVGVITGDDAKERRRNALIGAGVGAIAGGAVGAYMDAQEHKLRDRLADTGVQVVRDGDELHLVMPSRITFDVNSAAVRNEFTLVLDDLAGVLTEFDKTTIDVAGHTDSQGEWNYNQSLSEKRAVTVASELQRAGVLGARIVASGHGEARPVADNDTREGRAQNRRVDLKLIPIRNS